METENLKNIGQHENIITFYGCCTQDGPLYIILQLADKGNLRDFLRRNCFPLNNTLGRITEQDRNLVTYKEMLNFAVQVARGMQYLESIHVNTKKNIIIT